MRFIDMNFSLELLLSENPQNSFYEDAPLSEQMEPEELSPLLFAKGEPEQASVHGPEA